MLKAFVFLSICPGILIKNILGTGRVFFDRTGPAGLAFSTGPDRPVGTLDLTGKKPAENRPVQLRNITGEKPVRSI
jgi:hypothetical protein